MEQTRDKRVLDRIAQTARLTFLSVCVGVSALSSAFAADEGDGQRLYQDHCAGCHGEEGISDVRGTPDLASFELLAREDEDLLDLIRSGGNGMPPYLGILDDAEILDVISYLRALH